MRAHVAGCDISAVGTGASLAEAGGEQTRVRERGQQACGERTTVRGVTFVIRPRAVGEQPEQLKARRRPSALELLRKRGQAA